MRNKALRRPAGAMLAFLFLALAAFSQQPALRGFSAESSRAERDWEKKFQAIPEAARLRAYMRDVSRGPHSAGTAAERKNAEYILAKFREFGLEAQIEEFEVLLPTPKERLVEMVSPEKFRAALQEPAIAKDPDSETASRTGLPTFNAYSADGDVTAPLVYVNYGVTEDYEQLKKIGTDVKGKIVIARYGGSWRGIKPKLAAEHGAVGCLIYSDPRDDGYFQGDVFPEGPYRPPQGVQRGSVLDMPLYAGDPLTPGWASVKGAKRLPLAEARTLVKIPVLPISYADAEPLLKNLRGPVAPEAWRGALPVTYHLGPGPATVHLRTAFDWSTRPIYDVIARIPGSSLPEQWVMYGNHHDAWVIGANDPTSANDVVLETARALGELLKQGWRPQRTVILASWDAEEWGLLGSTEWAEKHAAELEESAVLYINSDATGKGVLNMSGSHLLERFINDVARDVAEPGSNKSVWESARAGRLDRARTDEEKKKLRESADLPIAALGSGSDYTPFLQHLGISALNLGFGGDDSGGVYHSIYDDLYWYTHFSDSEFVYGRALAQVMGTALMRMADADVLPLEFTRLAETVGEYESEVEKLAAQPAEPKLDFAPLRGGVEALKKSAQAYERALATAQLEGANRELNRVLAHTERAMLLPGLPGRPWYRHAFYAPGLYTGYAVKTLPGVREALEAKNWEEARQQIEALQTVLLAVAAHIDAAAKLLKH
jgi:N-acetylated-alpha-linked acidic dipeptidase